MVREGDGSLESIGVLMVELILFFKFSYFGCCKVLRGLARPVKGNIEGNFKALLKAIFASLSYVGLFPGFLCCLGLLNRSP